ncbi:MAG: HDOD domain-containing protein [Deltaproteobacteria bacterium]|nr:HDOD domain-containing protein [Deltaproteobacteria bacterium]MBW2341786.1 HDOD domain-containing protein [Deltaproteobacteria bacterium]
MKKQVSLDLLKQIESGYSLPSLSPVAMQLVEMALDDSSSAENLTALIEADPSLAVRVLKLANSTFFQTRQPTISLKQAIIKLGYQRLRIMALSLSLRDTFPMGKIGALDYEQLWHSTLYRALIAKSLAEHVSNCYPEEAFVAGLIMEIGLLILFDLKIRQDVEAPPISLEPLEDLISWEKKRYRIDHRQVGEAALKYWGFPDTIVQCQLLYGQNALSQDAPILAKICELSREFSCLLFQENAPFHTLFQDAEEFLGLDREVINNILIATFDEVQEIADSLSVEVNREGDLMEIMEKANRALSQISAKISAHQEITGTVSLPSFDSLDQRPSVIEHTLQAVAHEIRNPLLAVGGFARKLATSLDPDSKGGEYARIILEEASRLEKALSEMTTENR